MSIRILLIGAHPDDCEIFGGGTAALFAEMGYAVKFISMTNGNAGHHQLSSRELINTRSLECVAAAGVLGIAYEILDNADGQLMPTLENRCLVIQKIREWEADIVITHRPNDYHPDHRYTSQIVQDAAYLVMVPNIVMQTQILRKNPLFLYFSDRFQKPRPFSPDLAIAIDSTYEKKMRAIHAHTSQVYEWLPWIDKEENVPETEEERLVWLKNRYKQPIKPETRTTLRKWYGAEAADKVQHAEAFEICEYGQQPDDDTLRELFPMFE